MLPFLNLYIVGRFGLDLSQTNVIFALTSFGTMVAILVQPLLAQRYGRIGSTVLVQGASIPFLIALGFAPWLWLVVVAMAVRNSLMNASNPIYNAYVMERVRPLERATIAATMSLLWQLGWAVGGAYYAIVQGTFGFERGYNVNFVTIILLYALATSLYWLWFGRAERAQLRRGQARAEVGHLSIEISQVPEASLRDWVDTVGVAFAEHSSEEQWALDRALTEPDRVLGAYEATISSGGATANSIQLTVPGGSVAAAGVSAVGVLPTHRRQGVLAATHGPPVARRTRARRAGGDPVGVRGGHLPAFRLWPGDAHRRHRHRTPVDRVARRGRAAAAPCGW